MTGHSETLYLCIDYSKYLSSHNRKLQIFVTANQFSAIDIGGLPCILSVNRPSHIQFFMLMCAIPQI
jgi:hypothetical protein